MDGITDVTGELARKNTPEPAAEGKPPVQDSTGQPEENQHAPVRTTESGEDARVQNLAEDEEVTAKVEQMKDEDEMGSFISDADVIKTWDEAEELKLREAMKTMEGPGPHSTEAKAVFDELKETLVSIREIRVRFETQLAKTRLDRDKLQNLYDNQPAYQLLRRGKEFIEDLSEFCPFQICADIAKTLYDLHTKMIRDSPIPSPSEIVGLEAIDGMDLGLVPGYSLQEEPHIEPSAAKLEVPATNQSDHQQEESQTGEAVDLEMSD